MNRFLSPEGLARPNGFSHTARTTGRTTVFVSGQVSYDASGRVVGEAALQAEGASMHDVVKTVLFVRDLDPD